MSLVLVGLLYVTIVRAEETVRDREAERQESSAGLEQLVSVDWTVTELLEVFDSLLQVLYNVYCKPQAVRTVYKTHLTNCTLFASAYCKVLHWLSTQYTALYFTLRSKCVAVSVYIFGAVRGRGDLGMEQSGAEYSTVQSGAE